MFSSAHEVKSKSTKLGGGMGVTGEHCRLKYDFSPHKPRIQGV
jgi:hypothetical protein